MQLEIPVVKHNLAGSADVAAPVTMNMGYK